MRFASLLFAAIFTLPALANGSLFTLPDGVETRWISFENPTGAKGAGGSANKTGKGAAYSLVPAGETVTLADVEGSGTLRRMWFTLADRRPMALRSYVFRIYWDGEEKPAVEVPMGDFFGHPVGDIRPFDSALFSSPEGRSLNSTIPMPFRSGCKVTFTNESDADLKQLYYEIDFTVNDQHPDNMLYFHASWQRDPRTTLGEDFAILPAITGAGRFLGCHVGIVGDEKNVGWWGEGEVKVYLDGDTDLPTLVGTGTEDYVGTAYGQGEFYSRYQGSLLIDNRSNRWSFYRYHVPDPVYFHQDIRVTIQQMGGSGKKSVEKLIEDGVEVQPVSIITEEEFYPLLETGQELTDPELPDGWTNMYRRDDVCATALFYLDKPVSDLPALAGVEARTAAIEE